MRRVVVIVPIAAFCLFGTCCEETSGPPPSAAAPAGASFIDDELTPELIIGAVVANKSEAARQAEIANWVGKWIPEPGWFSTVEKRSEEQGRTVLWFKHSASALIGGSFLIGLDVVDANGLDANKVLQVSYTGRIDKIEVFTGGPVPEVKMVIRNGKLLKLK
ncbi:MAG: hypothetical protein AB7G11_00605 [Phycisphaerales bacterium]